MGQGLGRGDPSSWMGGGASPNRNILGINSTDLGAYVVTSRVVRLV